MASSWPQDEATFLEWFWKESNGNNLVKKLNNVGQIDKIRRETESPAVYCILLKDDKKWKEACGIVSQDKMRLCKVGFTHKPTKKGTNNRMEQVMQNIKKAGYEKHSVLFVLRIGAVDTTPYYDTEDRIRKKVGVPTDKEKTKKLNLPVPTEWVLTSQDRINEIKAAIERKKETIKKTKEGDVIDCFKEIKAYPCGESVPDEYKEKLL